MFLNIHRAKKTRATKTWAKKKRDKTRQGGFSLLEVVFALGLFAMGMLAVTLLTRTVMKTNQSARHYTEALFLAQNKLEEIKALEYSDVTDGTEAGLGGRVPGARGVFHRTTRVSARTSPPSKVVEVTVTWNTTPRGQVVLASIISP